MTDIGACCVSRVGHRLIPYVLCIVATYDVILYIIKTGWTRLKRLLSPDDSEEVCSSDIDVRVQNPGSVRIPGINPELVRDGVSRGHHA